jgi:cysteine desulfuration protein SufE
MDTQTTNIGDIASDFELLDEWEDRYRYVIELGRTLPPFPEEKRDDAHKVRGCASQVWFAFERDGGDDPRLTFYGDSDAHIVRGLIAILLALYSGKRASEALAIDPEATFAEIGLRDHLTAQRSNGLSAMVSRIRAEAETAAKPA